MFESVLLPIFSIITNPKKTQKAINFPNNKISFLTILSISEDQDYSIKAKEAISYALSLKADLVSHDDIILNIIRRKGKAENVICETADELNVDLIVIKSTGIDLLKDSKNTTSKVLEISPYPVLIVP